MDNCIFCKMIKGEIPIYKVWEDDKALAFLTISPFKKGHTLLIPKIHQDYFFDLEDDVIKDLAVKAKVVSKAIKQAFKPKSGKVGMILMGMGVHHAHIHLLPLDNESDINTSNVYSASQKELEEVSALLKQHF